MKVIIALLTILCLPYLALAQGTSARTGFVDGPVWFGEESLVLGKTTKIYTAIFNGEDTKLFVKVDFVDGTTVLSTKEITLNPNETRGLAIDWKITAGDHDIIAEITSATLKGESVLLERNTTEPVMFSVTKDTPGSVVKNALMSKFSTIFEGGGNFREKADSWFKTNFKKSEEFRERTLKSIESSKKLVEKRKGEEKNTQGSGKIITLIHFYALVVVGFIFSVSFIFYACAVVLTYLGLRTLWRIMKRLFRKEHDE